MPGVGWEGLLPLHMCRPEVAQEAAVPSRPTQGAVPAVQTPASYAAPRPQPESSVESLVNVSFDVTELHIM